VLRRLHIRNLAIVEDVALELSEGLTVITGETGAGKSILVDALALLAGGRGSSGLVRRGAEKLTVSGEFDADASARTVLADAGLPGGDQIVVRRELGADGRGRAFVEDEPAAVRTLARLGERMVAIHGQSSEQELADAEAPLEILDAYAKAEAEREATAAAAREWAQARERREALEASARTRTERLDLLEFQIREVESARPEPGEDDRLRSERQRLLHADRVRRAAGAALDALSEAEGSAADRLGEAARAFAELAAIDPAEDAHRDEADELKRRVADLAAAARDAAESIDADPDRLQSLETRLAELQRLERKHGVSGAALLERLEAWKAERAELSDVDDALDRRRRDEQKAREAYLGAARALSARRESAAAKLTAAVGRELEGLALGKARLRVALTPRSSDEPRASGMESAQFLFAPNPGEPEKPLERIASGGELSRLQLALRAVAAGKKARGRTFVFDEVDAGIGGRVAEVVGRRLRDLAAHDQVLCVTHVPQIAALADAHFHAEKSEVGGRTVAAVRRLDGKERVAEIARMLAGERVPATALEHARTLLAGAEKR
jgi:DNA repair protein RecN (Recombination protein N)